MTQFAAGSPVLLLPFRLETRFGEGDNGPELWVRIFPDQISIDTHEPELTDSEETAGKIYWEAAWRAGTGSSQSLLKERAAWQALAGAYGPQRGAWIARRLAPQNLQQRPSTPTQPGSEPKPSFPLLGTSDRRASSWERAPYAAGLPDHWTVALYSDGAAGPTHKVTSNPVRRPLAVGPTPGSQSSAATEEELQIDEGMRWMVDFDEAIAAGMAVRIPITQEQADQGFDRVAAVGIGTSAAPAQPTGPMVAGPSVTTTELGNGGPAFARLLDAHHYTDGLAFVPQGSPTNNTAEAASAYTRKDPGFERSYAVERRGPLALRDGQAAAVALGLPPETFEHVEDADGTGQDNATAMATALWPATLGYFLRQMMADVFSSEQQEQARDWFISRVRGRGPVPAFRVGDTPYGILPVTSLARWNPDQQSSPRQGLVTFLKSMLPAWLKGALSAPQVRPGEPQSADFDLVKLLANDASAQSYRLRWVVGDEFLGAYMRYLAVDDQYVFDPSPIGRALLDKYGYQAWNPRVIRMSLSEKDYEVSAPIVQDAPLSETEPLATAQGSPNYIEWLRGATVEEIRKEQYPGGTPPKSLLYHVLRQSILLEYANIAVDAQIDVGEMSLADAKEPELIDFPGRGEAVTGWTALAKPAPGITAEGQTMANYLDALPAEAPSLEVEEPPYVERLRELRRSLDGLSKLPTAELERLFTETLDVATHRLDGWITSVATDLLSARPRIPAQHVYEAAVAARVDTITTIHLGAFSVVEDLRPASRDPEESNLGFVHAPSLAQAAAGAVLRTGYLTHRERSDGRLLAVDLSSDRVRVALWLLDGVREGQPLAALLGYRFEAGLHRAGLGRYVQAFRNRFPVVAAKLTPAGGQPVEAIAASNVVDGEALYRAWTEKTLSWDGGLPTSGSDRAGVTAVLEELRDAVDALGDLSISESVFQLVRGNYARAGGLLDAISRAERPPEPEVVRVPRGGVDANHRLLLLMTGTPGRSANWQGSETLPRAKAEPRLDAWLSNVLPRPDRVRCRVSCIAPDASVKREVVRLSELGVGPLEVLDMAGAADEPQLSELEQRILYEALETLPAKGTEFEISFQRRATWQPDELTFPEFLGCARAVRDLVTGARPLGPEDLVEPGADFDPKTALDDANARLDGRASAARQELGQRLTALDQAIAQVNPASATSVDTLRDGLFAASFFGMAGAIPLFRTAPDQEAIEGLREQARAAAGELERRKDGYDRLDSSFNRTGAAPERLRDHLVELLQTLLGTAFPVLPEFKPPDGDAVGDAFSQSNTLVGDDTLAPARWLQQLTHVRPAAARLDMVRTTRALLGANPPELILGQLPYRTQDRWLALALTPGATPEPGRVALAAELGTQYDKTAFHAGLLIDSWTERIPSDEETTGVAFHYDRPTNRAPQCLLLAVCPDKRQRWDHDLLLEIVGESIQLARVRSVDLDTVADVGQLVPPAYFAFNPDGQAVSAGIVEIT